MAAREIFDVIVIGGVSAAHEAAVAARYYGARRVVMLEKAPPSESGGNARFSGTGFRFVFEPEEINEIVGLTDAEYARLRLRPYTADDFLGDGMTSGLSQLVQWQRIVDGIGGIDMRYDTKAIGFLGDESGVTRVRVLGPEGAHASPIDAASPDVESGRKAIRYGYNWGITVNSLGQRFIDEGEAEISYTYAKTGWAVLREPGGVAYQLGDANHPMTFMPDEPVFADSIAELAGKIGVEPVVLEDTVERFNAAIDTSVPYDRTIRDGRRTNGLSPDKSNWADALDTPPYFALPVTGGITFTFGGVKVDTSAQVIATGGRLIPGLYASGDLIGLFFHNYPSMTGQTRNLAFGRRAGAAAVK